MSRTCCNMRLAFISLLYFSLLIVVSVASEECDKSECKGPLMYYEDLKCKPIYKNPGDCCAIAYDCSHLLERSLDKCYANGNMYELGERLREEDRRSPCNIGCFCRDAYTGGGTFNCAVVDCFSGATKPGCYKKRNLNSCCPGEEICPENPEDRYKCQVDGKTYYDSEHFVPKEDSELLCLCMEGYKGENVEPFCRKTITCGLELSWMPQIRKNCAPGYGYYQSPSKTCNSFFRCQNDNDTIIHSESETPNENNQTCKYGDLELHIGDELNEAKDYATECVKCTCEVPPTLTCQRHSYEECSIKYPRNA